MAKQKRIENTSPNEGYENGLLDAKASKYKADPKFIYLLDKADRNLSIHQKFPLEYPNPATGLAYSYGAHVKTVLKIITAMTGDGQLEAETDSWFYSVWLPQAELGFQMGRIVSKRPQKTPSITYESQVLIKTFNDELWKIRRGLDLINIPSIDNKTLH